MKRLVGITLVSALGVLLLAGDATLVSSVRTAVLQCKKLLVQKCRVVGRHVSPLFRRCHNKNRVKKKRYRVIRLSCQCCRKKPARENTSVSQSSSRPLDPLSDEQEKEKVISEPQERIRHYSLDPIEHVPRRRYRPTIPESNRSESEYRQSPPLASFSHPEPALQPCSQPVTWQQQPPQQYLYPMQPLMPNYMPAYQPNGQQTAAAAMQLQASAMAMQAQASSMMMQAQQQAMAPPVMQPQMQTGAYAAQAPMPASADKQDKINRLMQKIAVLGECGTNRLLQLMDIEFDIIEHLLAGTNGQAVDSLVQQRTVMLQQGSPLITSAYELVIDLATSSGKHAADPNLYHYFVRKGKRTKNNTGAYGKKKFLRQMMYSLEQYYQMIEQMHTINSGSS